MDLNNFGPENTLSGAHCSLMKDSVSFTHSFICIGDQCDVARDATIESTLPPKSLVMHGEKIEIE